MRFRETLWFKKGSQEDCAPSQGSAETEEQAADTARPIEDRYLAADVSLGDSLTFGVHTGQTQSIRFMQPAPGMISGAIAKVPETVLIAEMKGSRMLLASLAVGVAALLGSALLLLS